MPPVPESRAHSLAQRHKNGAGAKARGALPSPGGAAASDAATTSREVREKTLSCFPVGGGTRAHFTWFNFPPESWPRLLDALAEDVRAGDGRRSNNGFLEQKTVLEGLPDSAGGGKRHLYPVFADVDVLHRGARQSAGRVADAIAREIAPAVFGAFAFELLGATESAEALIATRPVQRKSQPGEHTEPAGGARGA